MFSHGFPLVLPLLVVAGLSGCAPELSPEARCFAAATVEYRAARREAARIRQDLARGYGLHQTRIDVARAVPCRVAGARSSCVEAGRERLTLPVAIDTAELRARLAVLTARMAALRPPAMAAAAPCGYRGAADPDAADPGGADPGGAARNFAAGRAGADGPAPAWVPP